MPRIPVGIHRSHLVPRGFAAWVPRKRVVLVAHHTHLTVRLLAHELCHVQQAEVAIWPLAYVLQWIATGFSYHNMPYEVAARRAESEPFYLEWARELLEGE